MLELLRNIEGRSEGDPRKIADVIVRLANSDDVPVRLILGVDAENGCNGRKLRVRARPRNFDISLFQPCLKMRNRFLGC
jgi:hypothetical protein